MSGTALNRWRAPRPDDLGPARVQRTGTPFDEVFTKATFFAGGLTREGGTRGTCC